MRPRRKLSTRLICMVSALCLTVGTIDVRAQGERLIGSTILGTAYALSGRAAGRSAQFRLIINNFTSREALQRLNRALQSGGQDELLKAIDDMEAGRIQVGSGIGVDANVIVADRMPNGETKITVIYERSIRFSELRYGTRSQDYKFGHAELFLDQKGEGQGTLIPAAKIKALSDGTWEVEDFGTFPARLLGLRARGMREPR